MSTAILAEIKGTEIKDTEPITEDSKRHPGRDRNTTTVTLKLPTELYDHIRTWSRAKRYKSVEDFVIKAAKQEADKIENSFNAFEEQQDSKRSKKRS